MALWRSYALVGALFFIVGALTTYLWFVYIGDQPTWIGRLSDRLVWFAFTNHSTSVPGIPAGSLPGYTEFVRATIFACAAAFAFIAFVLIDTMIAILARLRPSEEERAGAVARVTRSTPIWHAAIIIAVGGIASWIVAFVTYLIGIKFDIVTALAVGVSWQVAYAKLVEQFRKGAENELDQKPEDAIPTDEQRPEGYEKKKSGEGESREQGDEDIQANEDDVVEGHPDGLEESVPKDENGAASDGKDDTTR